MYLGYFSEIIVLFIEGLFCLTVGFVPLILILFSCLRIFSDMVFVLENRVMN